MNLDRVTSGTDVPRNINVIIEIPAHADPAKYEVDKDTAARAEISGGVMRYQNAKDKPYF